MSTFVSACRICIEQQFFEDSLFAQTYPDVLIENRFFETKSLQVMIPIGPLCAGHLLVVAKHHCPSFGHPVDEIRVELGQLVQHIRDACCPFFGEMVAFEHGSMSSADLGACCIDHAHLNLVPLTMQSELAKAFASVVPTQLARIETFSEFVNRREPYLYLQCTDGKALIGPAPPNSSQFFRKMIASLLGMTEWDWRRHLNASAVHKIARWLKDRQLELQTSVATDSIDS
jgi:diadenosine tetraphosphate (Ap4A) HIT family hydrolase